MNIFNKDIYKKLEKYKDFSQQENPEKFLDIVDEMAMIGNSSFIKIFLSYFTDDRQYSWVFESLQAALFHILKKDNFQFFMISLDMFFVSSPKWCVDTLSILFNEKDYFTLFQTNMHIVPSNILIKIFDLLQEDSPHHKKLIAQLRSELENEIK
jgi:hypothetical protein